MPIGAELGYTTPMSTVELALKEVRCLDEQTAGRLLEWLARNKTASTAPAPKAPLGIDAMIGFARHLHAEPKTTAEWMAELRAGEAE